jgi:hypothetical protein
MPTLRLKSPLFTEWTDQHVRLILPGTAVGTALTLRLDGVPEPFQYTGTAGENGAEILLKIGFTVGQTRVLEFVPANSCSTDLTPRPIPTEAGACIGSPGRELSIAAPDPCQGGIKGPLAAFAGWPFRSLIGCGETLQGVTLTRVNNGPLFTDYSLEYRFGSTGYYRMAFRCFKSAPWMEIHEILGLGMNAVWTWTLNPEKRFTHILSRDRFEAENQPTVEPLGESHTDDVLCRLQMPVLGEYFVPTNRGWFALFDEQQEDCGMLGILGLHGDQWREPTVNMPVIHDRNRTVEWQASLASGARHWLLYAGAAEKGFGDQVSGIRAEEMATSRVNESIPGEHPIEGDGGSAPASSSRREPDARHLTPRPPDGRFVFHRLHAELNALRLDEHLDLIGEQVWDASVRETPALFATGDYHAQAQRRLDAFPELQCVLKAPSSWLQTAGAMHLAGFRYLLSPTSEHAAELQRLMEMRFQRWVRQFQGWREGRPEYEKNVIGFSRHLRGLLLGYEMLRRDGRLTSEQAARFQAGFVFATRRILDEGRWPHSRTALHPDHPESVRDLYAYGGEHKPDRLYWTNSLPNFQSDQFCALAHLAAVLPEHPDSGRWLRLAVDDLDRQLDAYCGESGAWVESINYALYTLSYFVITFQVLKARCGIDFFKDARVRRFAGWLVRFLGPKDKRWGVHTFPGIGNARLPTSGGEYLLCFAGALPPDDALRAELIGAYQRLAPSIELNEHYPMVMAALAPIPERTEAVRALRSEVMAEVGVAMRHRHAEHDESYL